MWNRHRVAHFEFSALLWGGTPMFTEVGFHSDTQYVFTFSY